MYRLFSCILVSDLSCLRMVSITRRITVCIMLFGFIEARQSVGFCNTGITFGDKSGMRSCAAALWGTNVSDSDSCTMWFPGNNNRSSPESNSAECDAISFDSEGQSGIADLGTVELRAFPADQLTRINITFSKIKWTSMWIRFKYEGGSRHNFCREFTISSRPVPPEKILFYDCKWQNEFWNETSFEFHATDATSSSVGKYRFKAPLVNRINPLNKQLNQSELFMYLDMTYQPLVKLHLQTAKDRFNIGPESYVVSLHRNTSSGYEPPKILKPVLVEEKQITYHYDTNGRKGTYFFTAKIDHVNCTNKPGCYITQSPKFVITGNPYDSIILLAIVGCGGIILSVLSFAFVLWRIRQNSLNACRPTVLMVYTPTTAKHTRAVIEFTKFLNKYCHVEALVDELGIPKTATKDPFTWCTDSLSKANAMMVVSSPRVACVHYERIYRNVDALCLRLLKEKMSDRKSQMKFLTVVLPYCKNNKAGIPYEAKHLRRFDLAYDLSKMLTYLHYGCTTFCHQFCVSPLIEGGLAEFSRIESDVVRAMREAEEEVNLGVEKCHHCNSASADHESGPLIERFKSVDMPCEPADDDKLLWPDIKHSPVTEEMFPGPIENLNLLGIEGTNSVNNSNSKKVVSGGFNLNKLDLG